MALTRLRDNMLRLPTVTSAQQEITAVKTDTGSTTLNEAITAKQITLVTAPVSQAQSEILQTTMESGVLLGETKTRYSESIVDSFEDTNGIDAARSSNYTFDAILKAIKVAP